MNRVQKKCFMASAGIHLMLMFLLLSGAAFITEAPKSPMDKDTPVINFVAFKTVDDIMTGGGSPNARLQPPSPAQDLLTKPELAPDPAPAPTPEPAPEPAKPEVTPDPTPEPVKPEPVKAAPRQEKVKPEIKLKPVQSDSLESSNKKSKKKEIELKPMVRQSDGKADAKARADAQRRDDERAAKQEADGRRRLADRFSRAANSLTGLSGGTEVALLGPGGGGVPYANFLQAVKSRYANAWTVPDGVTDEEATAVVSVTIARDGTVIHARITESSRNAAVDRSVRAVLDRVKWAAPLPENAREDQRTVSIEFNVRAKRGMG